MLGVIILKKGKFEEALEREFEEALELGHQPIEEIWRNKKTIKEFLISGTFVSDLISLTDAMTVVHLKLLCNSGDDKNICEAVDILKVIYDSWVKLAHKQSPKSEEIYPTMPPISVLIAIAKIPLGLLYPPSLLNILKGQWDFYSAESGGKGVSYRCDEASQSFYKACKIALIITTCKFYLQHSDAEEFIGNAVDCFRRYYSMKYDAVNAAKSWLTPPISPPSWESPNPSANKAIKFYATILALAIKWIANPSSEEWIANSEEWIAKLALTLKSIANPSDEAGEAETATGEAGEAKMATQVAILAAIQAIIQELKRRKNMNKT